MIRGAAIVGAGRRAWQALVLVVVPAMAGSPPCSATDWEHGGSLGLETRLFRDDDRSRTEDRPLAALGRLELRRRRGRFEERIRVFGRFDPADPERQTLIAEEAWLQASGPRLRLRLGVDVVNWSALEAFHPADVVNARNLEGDLEDLEKIGEPMAAVQLRLDDATSLSLLLMPVYTAPRLPSTRSRLGGAPVAALGLRGRRRVVDRDGELVDRDLGPQLALHLRRVLGSADVSLAVVEHIDRQQPLLRIDAQDGRPVLVYQAVREALGTYQQAFGSSVVKLEGSYRWFAGPAAAVEDRFGPLDGRDHGTVAAGLEHALPTGATWSSTLLLEGQAVLGGRRALGAFDAFQRDAFVGWRWAANDVAGRELLAGAIVDLERPSEHLLALTYRQRLGESWTLEAALRLFAAAAEPAASGGLQPLRDADHLRLVITRHF
jgi:hypothetical protein